MDNNLQELFTNQLGANEKRLKKQAVDLLAKSKKDEKKKLKNGFKWVLVDKCTWALRKQE